MSLTFLCIYFRIYDVHVLNSLSSDNPADMYRNLFKFGVFNAVQSKCFQTVRISLGQEYLYVQDHI